MFRAGGKSGPAALLAIVASPHLSFRAEGGISRRPGAGLSGDTVTIRVGMRESAPDGKVGYVLGPVGPRAPDNWPVMERAALSQIAVGDTAGRTIESAGSLSSHGNLVHERLFTGLIRSSIPSSWISKTQPSTVATAGEEISP